MIDSQASRRQAPPPPPQQQRRRRSRGRGAPPPEPQERSASTVVAQAPAVKIPSGATVRDVAEHLGVQVSEVIKKLMEQGEMASITQTTVSGWTRLPSLALPLGLVALAAGSGAIACLNPYYGRMADPDRWIRGFLVPNPAAALGTLLKIDILRFGLVYDHVRAIDYCSLGFRYPSPVWTAALYAAIGAAALAASAARLARRG